MEQQKTKKMITDALTIAVVIGVFITGYYVFKGADVTESGIVTQKTEIADQVVQAGVEVDTTIRNLKNLQSSVVASSVVFAAPSFMSLQDLSTKITPEKVGRPDPFVPTSWKLAQKSK